MSNSPLSPNHTDMFNIDDYDDTDYQTIINEAESYDTHEDLFFIKRIEHDFAGSDSNGDNNDSKNPDTVQYSFLVWFLILLAIRPLVAVKEAMLLIYEFNLLIGTIFFVWYLTSIEECNGRTGCLLGLVSSALIVFPLFCIKGCIAGTVILLSKIVLTIVMKPILFIWYKLPRPYLCKRYKTWFTLFVLSILCISFLKYTKTYMPITLDYMSSKVNCPEQSNTEMVETLKLLQEDNLKLWTELKRTQELLEYEISIRKSKELKKTDSSFVWII